MKLLFLYIFGDSMQTNVLIAAALALYGLLIGSFLNAWVWRIRTGRKVSQGRSMCPHCHTPLKWYELIPVLSWLGLRGKCRTCHKPISWQYPAVELANAMLWAGIYLSLSPSDAKDWLVLALWLALSSLMLASFVYDARWMELPDQFLIPSVTIASLIAVSTVWTTGNWTEFVTRVLAAALFAGIFWLIWKASGGAWLGDGDIWLAGIMGLALSGVQLVTAIFIGFNLGAIVGVILIAIHQKTRKSTIAFGPFLIAGLFSGFFWGGSLLNWYLGIFI